MTDDIRHIFSWPGSFGFSSTTFLLKICSGILTSAKIVNCSRLYMLSQCFIRLGFQIFTYVCH